MSSSGMLEAHKTALAVGKLQREQVERRLAWLGNIRFALVLLFLAMLFLAVIDKLPSALWLGGPVIGFVILSFLSEYYSRQRSRIDHTIRFQEHVISRMEDRWAGHGFAGLEFLPADHPCAADLDLFGEGSLFERLCLCATRSGREKLAEWILHPAEPAEIRARQEAIQELSNRPTWRERNFLLGSKVPNGINTTGLAKWGELSGVAPNRLRFLAPGLVAMSVFGAIGMILQWWPPAVVIIPLLIQAGFALLVMGRVQRALSGLDRRSSDLQQLSELLLAIECESFTSPLLNRWKLELRSENATPSQTLQRLGKLIELLDMRRNFLFAIFSPFVLWGTQIAFAIENWRRRTGAALSRWVRILGEMEAITSIASYAAENQGDTFPEIRDGAAQFEAKELSHPLLPRSRCVANSLTLNSARRLLVLSGSNMSGKSTLLRSVGVNAVLAQMGAPVRAAHLRLSRLAIGATLHVQDSLQQGRSRFYAEISRLRLIIDLTKGALPVLFLLDEILHGTNSHDRKLGAEAVVRSLLERTTIGLVTTHDLALTQLADALSPLAANVHFEDDFSNGEMHFDYRLKEGPILRGNGLALMRAIGLEVSEVTE